MPVPELLLRTCFRTELLLRRLLVPLRVRRLSLAGLLKDIEPKNTFYSGLESSYVLQRVRKALRRPLLMKDQPCLREGLLAYHFLRRAQHDPVLVFAVDASCINSTRAIGHCWIQLDGKAVFNQPDRDMVVVLRHSRLRAAK